MGELTAPAPSGREPTMHVGPLGSTIHVLRADAGTIVELASLDWTSSFRRVCLDPVSGLIVLMAPSRLHEDLSEMLGNFVDIAASVLESAARGLRTARLRGSGALPGTGMEPDCAFYVGANAHAYVAALAAGDEAADAFFEKTPPDLVVEVEITSLARAKIARYADLGVRELWLFRSRRASNKIPEVDFLDMHVHPAPAPLAASNVLGGVTPADVREAVHGLRRSATLDERIQVVTRIVRRRQNDTVRVREESTPYPARP